MSIAEEQSCTSRSTGIDDGKRKNIMFTSNELLAAKGNIATELAKISKEKQLMMSEDIHNFLKHQIS